MITENQILDFERLTNFPLTSLLFDVKIFFAQNYPKIIDFYKGKTDNIKKENFKVLHSLMYRIDLCIDKFGTNKKLFNRAYFWDILDAVEDIKVKLLTTDNSSKFLRSSVINGSTKGGIAIPIKMDKNTTLENISSNIVRDIDGDNDWVKIAQDNDLKEEDWDIDGGTNLIVRKRGFQNNLVTTFIDNTIGERIYGKDIAKKFEFVDDDLKILGYVDTAHQTVGILAELTKGDIPENPGMGLNASLYKGVNYSQLNLPSISRELGRNFNTDDLFRDFEVTKIEHREGDIYLEYQINTKYDLLLIKNLTI